MKKLFATLSCMALLTLGLTQMTYAQEATADAVDSATTEQVTPTPVEEAVEVDMEAVMEQDATADQSFHQALKTKFIEGGADFMALIALVLILGLVLCLERIIYLNLADNNYEAFLRKLEEALNRGDMNGAKEIARNTRGPVASIAYQALMRFDQGIDVVERSIVSYGGVQGGLLEKNLSWITLFIAIAPSLGFLGTVVGMVMAFDKIEKVGDISPTVVAGGMKVALITTIGGLIVAMILQVFYNYILSKVESILNRMEDASITLVDFAIKYNLHK
ncbi:MotA/TolQ/ExbB proton channel family protein [Porphyromonas asaccharolytica]|uniref:MotA/TolQ/ExbB proton channel n=1 Tax=Porphyromonas asaccharolytica (strain ATCC 25260 / DSM 20707 / BCRC 10618 / CCUG 7834 / JCM 6326 / LMG 13178 / VPI 4198 / B440) TaxID=879243 RepID=F4KNP3_PORAD|nr:MotA/TolQ/ExbB proton channel family protein [Porphyromonas asaccharolytica]AEE13490.1 MotA/TolQ/ExbB proton channel [Porphyromonas asaccharolytica DSM 20707]